MAIEHCDVMFGAITTGIQVSQVMFGSYWKCKSVISTGTVQANDEGGDQVSGALTTGNWYSLRSTGDSWREGGLGNDQYTFQVSIDGGSNWSLSLGYSNFASKFFLRTISWVEWLEKASSFHARIFWQDTTGTIDFRVGDNAGEFGDNTGDFDWELCNATAEINVYGARLG